MFYMFIVFLAITTIVLDWLQRNHEKNHLREGQPGEKTASPDTGEGHQADNQDEPPIPPTTTPQTIPLPEQQAEIFTAQHPITDEIL